MKIYNRTLSIRLLKDNVQPRDSVKDINNGLELQGLPKPDGALAAFESTPGSTPRWANFLELTDAQKGELRNQTSSGLVFINVRDHKRWFAISFGHGHHKLDKSKCEQNFGLRVVMNSVDSEQLKSVDARTLDENGLLRRSQTSRGVNQAAFSLDHEKEVLRGLAGKPKDSSFASRVEGADQLTITREMKVDDLEQVCSEVYEMYKKDDYQKSFSWVDQIRHVREKDLISDLKCELIEAINRMPQNGSSGNPYFSMPMIYNPANPPDVLYEGLGESNLPSEPELNEYLNKLKQRNKRQIELGDLEARIIYISKENGQEIDKQKIIDCLAFEVDFKGQKYILSDGKWYQIATDWASEVANFFKKAPKANLLFPNAEKGENEGEYNERLQREDTEGNLLCMDRKLFSPPGASSSIEICDLITSDRQLIHVKNKSSSSKLSHLFNQGTVSARELKVETGLRTEFGQKVKELSNGTNQGKFGDVIANLANKFDPGKFRVVFAVISTQKAPRLPFFSLITFRQAAKELEALGYEYAFNWIQKDL